MFSLLTSGSIFIANTTHSSVRSQTILIDSDDQSVASALFQTCSRLGYPIGLAIATIVRDSVEKSRQGSEAELDGLRAAMWTCTGLIATCKSVVVGPVLT